MCFGVYGFELDNEHTIKRLRIIDIDKQNRFSTCCIVEQQRLMRACTNVQTSQSCSHAQNLKVDEALEQFLNL